MSHKNKIVPIPRYPCGPCGPHDPAEETSIVRTYRQGGLMPVVLQYTQDIIYENALRICPDQGRGVCSKDMTVITKTIFRQFRGMFWAAHSEHSYWSS